MDQAHRVCRVIMKKYHVTGLGNALVDLEFSVDKQFFADNNIEKGVMTLIEKEQHLTLLKALQPTYQIRKKASGGSAANTLVTAAQFGARAFYCCKVGNDDFGQFYREDLRKAGVEHQLDSQNDTGETGKCIVMVSQDADRTMNTFLGITATLGQEQVVEDAIKNSEIFYIEGHLMYSEEAVAAILKAKQIARDNQVRVALTISDPAVVKYVRANLEKVLGEDGVDILFCNGEEATDFGNGDLEAGITRLKQYSKLLVVTHGKDGATIYDQQQGTISIPPHVVTAQDTTGAGDTFAGAFLYGLTQGMDLQQTGKLANRTAAECVSHFGPRLTALQQQDIVEENNFSQ